MGVGIIVFIYNSTKQTSSPVNKWGAGVWNINYRGNAAQFMRSYKGLQWTQMRRKIREAFLDTSRDQMILDRIKLQSDQFIPTRSGYLKYQIFKTMFINRRQYYSTHYWAEFDYSWPTGSRPYPIKGRTGHQNEIGYGDLPPYPGNNVNLLEITPGLNGKYLLVDPNAVNDPKPQIQSFAVENLQNDYDTIFNQALEIEVQF